MNFELNNLLASAAFIGAGMHRDISRLDKAREAIDTGCFEFIFRAVSYTQHIDALFEAGRAVSDNHGMVDYEISEEFGAWYVEDVLRQAVTDEARLEGHPADWPAHGAVCTQLLEMFLEFFSTSTDEQRDQLVVALNAVPAPTEDCA